MYEEENETSISNSVGQVILIIFLAFLTLGITLIWQYSKDGMKGKH